MWEEDQEMLSIEMEIPASDAGIYSSKAIDDVLVQLARNPYESYTAGELAETIGVSTMTVRRAIDTLVANNLIVVEAEGVRKPVRINRARLSKPDDPILAIPQPEYHDPVRVARDELIAELDGVIAIVLYGSVASGDADRRSDIDLWVLVDADRARSQRAANRIRTDLEDQEFNDHRYWFDIDIEARDSVPTYTDAIREILQQGLPIYTTDEFNDLKTMVLEMVE